MRWLWVLFFGLLTTGAQAASFDCTKASTDIEHAICNSPELSRLDGEMAASYGLVPKDSRYFDYIKQDQKRWLNGERKADFDVFERRANFLSAFGALSRCLAATDEPASCLEIERATMDACMSAGDYTTYAMNSCGAVMAQAWDGILEVETDLKRQALAYDPETLALFDTASEAFSAYRDAECSWRYSEYRDGTIRWQIWFGCYLDLTARRAISTIQENQM